MNWRMNRSSGGRLLDEQSRQQGLAHEFRCRLPFEQHRPCVALEYLRLSQACKSFGQRMASLGESGQGRDVLHRPAEGRERVGNLGPVTGSGACPCHDRDGRVIADERRSLAVQVQDAEAQSACLDM